MSEDLFGELIPEPTPPPPARFHELIFWQRLDRVRRPECMHCQMLAFYGEKLDVLKAHWTRTARDGSTLELCGPHTIAQQEHDAQMEKARPRERLYELRYKALADAIVDTMPDPDDWDDGESPTVDLLIDYVRIMALKLHDINLVLDRDMETKEERSWTKT